MISFLLALALVLSPSVAFADEVSPDVEEVPSSVEESPEPDSEPDEVVPMEVNVNIPESDSTFSDLSASDLVSTSLAAAPARDLGNLRAYASVSNSDSRVSDVRAVLSTVPFGTPYVFLQDSNYSYVLVYGSDVRSNGNGGYSGSGHWVRWYRSSDSGYYWLVERGSGLFSASSSGYQVLTNIDGTPVDTSASDLVSVLSTGFLVIGGLYVVQGLFRWLLR